MRTGAHKCAHTLFRHEFNWETTWKHVFHHFATCLQVFDNFHNFWILCAQVRTSAHTHYSDMNSTGKQLGNMFSTTLLLACKFLTTFIIFLKLCAQVHTGCAQVRTGAHRCAQVRTGGHKCAHTLFRHEFNWETTWKHVFHHLLLACKFLTTFIIFLKLCAQVRTSAHTHYSDMNSTGKQLGNMFSTTLLLACKFLTTFIIFLKLCAQVAHRCAQVRTHTIQT